MTQNDFDSFISILMGRYTWNASWYWLMLDMAQGKFDAEKLNSALKISGNKTGPDADMLRRVVYFNEHKTDTDVKTYLNIVRFSLPIIVNDSLFKNHKEQNLNEHDYYTNIIEFASYIGAPKLQYDVLTRAIDKLYDKMKREVSPTSLDYDKYYREYSVARALRSANDYAQNPAQHTKRDPNDKWFEYNIKSTIKQIRDTRMDDLHYYMQVADKMYVNDTENRVDKTNRLKFEIANAMIIIGLDQVGDIAACPHAHFGPNNQFENDISQIVNTVRHNMGYITNVSIEYRDFYHDVVCQEFTTGKLSQQILSGTFNAQKTWDLIAAEQQKILTAAAEQKKLQK